LAVVHQDDTADAVSKNDIGELLWRKNVNNLSILLLSSLAGAIKADSEWHESQYSQCVPGQEKYMTHTRRAAYFIFYCQYR